MIIEVILVIIGMVVCLSSIYFSQTSFKFGMFTLFLGVIMIFSGAFFMEAPHKDFCESNNGIFEYGERFNTCYIPDINGDYVVYRIIEINDEIKLARFSDYYLQGETAQ